MIIDAHAHFGPGLVSTAPFGPLVNLADGASLLAVLAASGIDRAVAFAPRWQGGTFVDPDYRHANAAVASGMHAHPDRLVGFVRVNPKFGRGAAEQAEAGLREGFQGIKLDPETEAFSPLDLRLIGPLFEAAQAAGAPVLVHTNVHPAEPLLWLEAAQAFPRVPLILGHMGYRITSDAVITAERASNVYLETSGNMPGYIMRTIKRLGSARMIFGTDAPFNHPDVEVRRMRRLNLSDRDFEQITGGTISALLPRGWRR